MIHMYILRPNLCYMHYQLMGLSIGERFLKIEKGSNLCQVTSQGDGNVTNSHWDDNVTNPMAVLGLWNLVVLGP